MMYKDDLPSLGEMMHFQNHGAIMWPRNPSQSKENNGHTHRGQLKGRDVTVMDGMGSAYHSLPQSRFHLSSTAGSDSLP